ncbi:MAG: cytochrome c biogenesis protein CcsA [Thermaceae bacterium]|nr:cytochrome c biogenesis protein CcsA [Thermaceae bacterium]
MNPGLLGGIALGGALLFSLLGLALAALAWYGRDWRALEASRRVVGLVLLAALTAFAALEAALLSGDFAVRYVANHHSLRDPLWITLVTPWAALEGSLLLWATLQTFYTTLVTRRIGRDLDPWRAPLVLMVLFGLQVFFFGVMVLMANPFEAVPNPPTDGRGPNPLLQNHWMMAVHPVLMYLGFVGLSVPFAYAVAAMIARRYQSWIVDTRWWTLVAWGFLTAAIVAGGWWSYEVLGWGGYWAWDPVENASFIPWLLASAFIHTAQVQERKGLFRSWNFAFITLAFAATVLGTFLTRSGVIQSVHAFASGPIGPVFLGFFLLVLVLGFGLLSRTFSEVRDAGEIRWLSREGALLLGSLLFQTLAFVVLLGTLWPLVIEATTGAKVSIGAPFFNQVSAPLGVGLLLMGVGPVLPWRNSGAEVQRNLVWLGLALLGGTALGLLVGWTLGVSLALGLFAYNLLAVGLMLSQGIRERARSLGVSAWASFVSLAVISRRRFGSHIVHVGVALLALSVAFSQTYRAEAQKTLQIGETWRVMGLSLTLEGLGAREEANRTAVIARVRDERLGELRPRLNFYPSMGAPLAAPNVRYTLYQDYYLVLQAFDQQKAQWATLRLIVTPMVFWLWVGGVLMVLGSVYALWPRPGPLRAQGQVGV